MSLIVPSNKNFPRAGVALTLTANSFFTVCSPPPRPRVQGWYYYISDYVFDSSTNSSSSVGENPAFGDLMFTLTQGSFSLMELSEENPIDMFGYIGNIGGFWGECTSPPSAINITYMCI